MGSISVNCTYCGFRTVAGEARCRRCGRKPGDTLTGEFALPTEGALAALPQPATRDRETGSRPQSPDLSKAVQRPLFLDRPADNVIRFEEYRPAPPEPRRRKSPETAKPRRPRSRVPESQGSLDFLPAAPDQPRTLGTTVEAVVICEAPVAAPVHRAIAAAFDWSMVFLGYGLFVLGFQLAGGHFLPGKANLMLYGAALLLIAFTYGLIWTLAGTETAGMRWAGLRLITFEGFAPEPQQRVLRFLGSCLSLCTVVGMLWSLADEESLTWQDHISGTFPTPVASESQVFCRR
jgi:uncharacterized RDD family membrane protein YckC